jgi:hypothetical protein
MPPGLQFGADLQGAGVRQVVEDLQRLPPGIAGGHGIAGRVLGVAEMIEDFGLVVPVADFPEQPDGLLVAGDRFGVLAADVTGVAENAQGLGRSPRWASASR